MPRIEEMPKIDQIEIRTTVDGLNILFQTILESMPISAEEFTFPNPIKLKSGAMLTSLPFKAAPGIIEKLRDQANLLIAVKTEFTGEYFKVGQFFLPGQKSGPKFIGAFFTGNFLSLCNRQDPDAAGIKVRQAIGQVLYQDALMYASETPRGKLVKVPEKLVGIFETK